MELYKYINNFFFNIKYLYLYIYIYIYNNIK